MQGQLAFWYWTPGYSINTPKECKRNKARPDWRGNTECLLLCNFLFLVLLSRISKRIFSLHSKKYHTPPENQIEFRPLRRALANPERAVTVRRYTAVVVVVPGTFIGGIVRSRVLQIFSFGNVQGNFETSKFRTIVMPNFQFSISSFQFSVFFFRSTLCVVFVPGMSITRARVLCGWRSCPVVL